jgi:hypothetical protein
LIVRSKRRRIASGFQVHLCSQLRVERRSGGRRRIERILVMIRLVLEAVPDAVDRGWSFDLCHLSDDVEIWESLSLHQRSGERTVSHHGLHGFGP